MSRKVRAAHYINQFFGGIGGEEAAGTEVLVHDGAVGPGRALANALGEHGEVAVTVICGDNYFHEESDKALATIVTAVEKARADFVIAGPAFASGRYGLACAQVCQAVQERLHLPAVTGMHPNNPGVEQYRRHVYIVPTAASAAGMAEAMSRMVGLALKLTAGAQLGSPGEEGYIARGIRRNVFREEAGAVRAVDMLLHKLRGEPFASEIQVRTYDRVPPAPPVSDLKRAVLAIVTEAGVVPIGNPDHLEWARASKWAKYSIKGLDDLTGATHEAVHGGFDNTWVNEDPDRVLGVDSLRALERAGIIGRLYDYYYVTTGNGTTVEMVAKIGAEIAQDLKAAGVTCAVLPST